jgi:hypothetical protein
MIRSYLAISSVFKNNIIITTTTTTTTTTYSVLRQAHNLFQSEFPETAYVFFLIFPSFLSF